MADPGCADVGTVVRPVKASPTVSVVPPTVSGMVNKDEGVAALRELLEELLAFTANVPDEAKTPRGRRFELVRIKAVVALALHTHRLGRAVATLLDAGFGIEAAPTVRAVLEHGITAQWLFQYGDEAAYGFAQEAQRQRKAAGGTLSKLVQIQVLGADDVAQVLELIEEDAKHEIEQTSATPGGRHFQARCRDFANGESFYFAYRVLSDLVHPGPTVCDAYVESHDPLSFQTWPKAVSNRTTWLHSTCCGLVWAARAVDMLNQEHPNREFLRRAARQLGISPELVLSPEAVVRRGQDRQARKHARRGGSVKP